MRSPNSLRHLRSSSRRDVCKHRPPSAAGADSPPSAHQDATAVRAVDDHRGADRHDSLVLTSEQIGQLGKLILERELLLRTRMCLALQARLGEDGVDPNAYGDDQSGTAPAGMLNPVANGTLTQVIEELLEIEKTKETLKNKTFGFCVMCHGPIGFNRLLALPTVARCLSCQEDHEHGRAWRSAPLH